MPTFDRDSMPRRLTLVSHFAFLLFCFCIGCRHPQSRIARSDAAERAPAFEEIHKLDVHAHIFEDLPQLNEMMRRNNVSIVNVCNRGRDGHLETMHRIAREMYGSHPDLFPFASCFDLTRIEEPGYTNQVIASLDDTFNDGAVMTKIWKEVGMEVRRKDGSFVLPDDPIFDPIYEFLAARGKPLMAHLADPIDGWLPLNTESVHYGYYANNPEFQLYGKPGYPSHAALIAARDHILEKHPRLVVIGAHFGSLEHDLDEVARRLDRYPNFYVDCAARTRDLTRQPREKVRSFFIKYQDRILYGVDSTWKPFREKHPPTDEQRASFINGLEKKYRADYAFYAGTGPMQYDDRTVEGLAFPRKVLEKFYHENARRIILKPAEVQLRHLRR
ncbi:MAG: amidohydrolase family protein [Verrucomicrobiota bacterium]